MIKAYFENRVKKIKVYIKKRASRVAISHKELEPPAIRWATILANMGRIVAEFFIPASLTLVISLVLYVVFIQTPLILLTLFIVLIYLLSEDMVKYYKDH